MWLKEKIKSMLCKTDEVSRLRALGAKVGNDVWIGASDLDHGHAYLIEIGDRVTITHATLLAHDASIKREVGKVRVGKITIGNDVFVGWGSIILPNVHIGNKVVVGAGSVVTRDVPENSIVAGNPARVIGVYDDYMEKHKGLMQQKPCFDTYWKNKTEEEKAQMSIALTDTFGYDQ